MEPSTNFLATLKSSFGSTVEFSHFERDFYAQREEIFMLRQNLDVLRSSVTKLGEEKRVLELELMSERAERKDDATAATTNFEKARLGHAAEIYSLKCEVEAWRGRAEVGQKELSWLKEQLKVVEVERAEGQRAIAEHSRTSGGIEGHRANVEATLKRVKDALQDIQKRVVDLEVARDSLGSVTAAVEGQLSILSLALQNKEAKEQSYEARTKELEAELIQAKAQLVQNNAELERTTSLKDKTEQLVNKLVVENKDLHGGLSALSSLLNLNESPSSENNQDHDDNLEEINVRIKNKAEEDSKQMLAALSELHSSVMSDVEHLYNEENKLC